MMCLEVFFMSFRCVQGGDEKVSEVYMKVHDSFAVVVFSNLFNLDNKKT